MTRRSLIVRALVGVVVLLAAFFVVHRLGWLADEPPRAEPPKPSAEPGVLRFPPGAPQLAALRVEPVKAYPVPLAEPLSARVAYDENATSRLGAPIAGRVMKIAVEPGDQVKSGDVLLTLDSPDLATAIADAEKSIAEEARSRAAFERARALFEGGVVPRKELETAQAELRSDEAEAQRARLRLRNLTRGQKVSGETFVLRAPISGVVVERKVNPGSEVRPDMDPLFVITDPARLWVMIDLPEHALGRVEIGRTVAIEVDAFPQQQFMGRIARIADVIDPQTRRVQVRCVVENNERKLKPEMFARVRLLADQTKTALRLPNAAVITEGVNTFAFVERDPGVFEKRKVVPTIQDREYTYIAEGLSEGERVVVSGALLLNSELRSSAT